MDEWWRTFFDERYRAFWSEMTSDERTAAEVAGILRLLERHGLQRARILDLACGDARIATGLARAGHDVTGLDVSGSQLRAARERIAAAGVEVRLVEADMRRPPEELGPFDCVLSWFTSFGYFHDAADDLRVLEAVRDLLVPGGLFLLETQHRDRLARISSAQSRAWEERDGTLLLIERFFDPVAGRAGERLRFVSPDGEEERRTFSTRLYTATELGALVRAVGLVVEGVHGGTDDEPVSADTRLLLVGRREGGRA
jgi:SAM-dependent methyltransferase